MKKQPNRKTTLDTLVLWDHLEGVFEFEHDPNCIGFNPDINNFTYIFRSVNNISVACWFGRLIMIVDPTTDEVLQIQVPLLDGVALFDDQPKFDVIDERTYQKNRQGVAAYESAMGLSQN